MSTRRRNSAALALEGAAPVFAALGDETRLRLVTRLATEGPLSMTKLGDGVPISRQAVAKHLRVLEGAGVVRGRRQGRESVWAIEAKRLQEVERHLERISAGWDAAIERLRAIVETGD